MNLPPYAYHRTSVQESAQCKGLFFRGRKYNRHRSFEKRSKHATQKTPLRILANTTATYVLFVKVQHSSAYIKAHPCFFRRLLRGVFNPQLSFRQRRCFKNTALHSTLSCTFIKTACCSICGFRRPCWHVPTVVMLS